MQLLFGTPLRQCYVRQLARETGLTLHTVQDELRKLVAVGLLNSWSNGYDRFYRANRDHAFFAPLTKIVRTNAKLPKTKKNHYFAATLLIGFPSKIALRSSSTF